MMKTMLALLRELRPYQWIKNILVFVPVLAAHQLGTVSVDVHVSIAFLVFCMAASAGYILNDMRDINEDRQHIRKRHRPFAAGDISVIWGWILWPFLTLCAFCIALIYLPNTFIGILVSYCIFSMLYSMYFKKKPVIDVLVLSALYTLRIIGGAMAAEVKVSFWLLAFSIFFFLSLAFMKRFNELYAAYLAMRFEQIRGRGYTPIDINVVAIMGVVAGFLAMLVLALYVNDAHTAQLYGEPALIWLVCPLLLYWILRCWLFAYRGQMHDDPVIFALQDSTSWIVLIGILLIFAVAMIP